MAIEIKFNERGVIHQDTCHECFRELVNGTPTLERELSLERNASGRYAAVRTDAMELGFLLGMRFLERTMEACGADVRSRLDGRTLTDSGEVHCDE